MKKIIILLALLPALIGWSQDTVSDIPREGYFYNTLPNLKEFNGINGANNHGDTCGVVCKRLISPNKEPLKVYGVAAAMITDLDHYDFNSILARDSESVALFWEDFYGFFIDTTLDNAYEYVGLYLRSGDSLEVQQQKRIHRKYDTATYYVRPDPTVWAFGNPNFVYPMYERYFDSVITVSDTFYVGATERSHKGLTSDINNFRRHVGLSVVSYFGSAYNRDYIVFKYCYPEEGSVYWSLINQEEDHQEDYYMMIFPILTPEGSPSGDSTAVVTAADMVSRYVAVQPNPAKEEARVLSSFGLTRIEVYDDKGRQVMAREASGYEATLDVKAWPIGTYILRVATPMGTAVKKLLVR